MESPSISGGWYAAVLVIRSRVGVTTDSAPLLDHQVRLLRARDAENAYERALALGADETHSYSNSDGETVTWEFAGLHDLTALLDDDLSDGVEVYSWRTRDRIDDAVRRKEQLTVFWSAANADRTARQLLDDHRNRAV
jgi:hypothetical protein